MTLQKFLEDLAEAAEQKMIGIFTEVSGEQLFRMRNEFRSEFLTPSKRKLREMLKVRPAVNPSELIDLACEEIDSHGLPLVKFTGQMVMTPRGPMATPVPISLEPGGVNGEEALKKIAEVFHAAVLNAALDGFIYSDLQRDLGIIEGTLHTSASTDSPELSSADETKLREGLKASIIDVKSLIKEFGQILSTGQYV